MVGLFGMAGPAAAAGPDPLITDVTVNPGTIAAGATTTVSFTVKNNGDAGTITVEVSSSNNKVTCANTCKFVAVSFPKKDDPGSSKPYSIKFTASGTFTNDEQANFTVKAADKSEQQQVTINAPKQTTSASVPEVSGTVVDQFTGVGVSGAKVFVQDSASQTFDGGTDKSGNFKIASTPEKSMKPGVMSFTVEKDGIQPFPGYTKTAVAGQPLTGVRLTIAPIASSASAGASEPADVAGESSGPAVEPLDSGADEGTGGGSAGGGGLSWMLIAVGGVLVALGVGAIVLLFVRKKGDDGDDQEDPRHPRQGGPGGPPGGPGGPPPGRGGPRPPQRRGGPPEMAPPMRGGAPGYDQTRQMRPPVSPGPRGGGDQTMIAPSPLANAPTQMHSRVPPADHADPYGAPTRHNGGQPGYPPAQGGSYGAGGGYGQAGQPANPTPGYPGGAPGYGPAPDQYGQPYGQQPYGQTPAADPYGQPAGGGYAQSPEYGQAGYGQDGYGAPGYDTRPDPRSGGRPGGAPPTQPDPRRVDWLDD